MEREASWAVIALPLLLSFTIIAYKLWRKADKGVKLLPPGSLGLPVLGETLSYLGCLRRGSSEFVRARVARHGEVFKTHLFGYPTVVAASADGNRLVFGGENKVVEVSWPDSVISVLGRHSLIAKTSHDAKRIRHALMTFLGFDSIQKLVCKADLSVQKFLDLHWADKPQVLVYPSMKHLAFSIACSLFVSRDDEDEICRLEELFMEVRTGSLGFQINIPGTPFWKALKAAKKLRSEFGEWIEDRRKELERGKVDPKHDLLSCLLCFRDEEGQPLSDDEIKDNILLLLFGGHDTSTVAMSMLFKYLAENPECLKQVWEEQEEIAQGKCGREFLNWNDLKKMKVSWRIVQETLRLQPPAYGAFRLVIQDFEYMGYKIPKGWKMHWHVAGTHGNPEYFAEPTKFKPCRFEGNGPSPFSFVPFGGGQRICPGYEFARLETLVLLHHAVRLFHWEQVDPQEPITIDPFPRPINGLPIKLYKIKSQL